MPLGEGDEAPQKRVLDAELEAQRALEFHISREIPAQHDALDSEDCAIWSSMSMSTLARLPAVRLSRGREPVCPNSTVFSLGGSAR